MVARQKNIAVIGGGAKAAALAAKAWCLRELGVPIRVSIFEKHTIGSAWSGYFGYTDGAQRLCTPAERDLGFPYGRGLKAGVSALMQSRFSWMAFKQARGSQEYSDWVNRGRKPPTHAEFAQYLAFAVAQAGADIFYGDVKALAYARGRWAVLQIDKSDQVAITTDFHGAVVTGPGPARAGFPKIASPRIVDGESFWRQRGSIAKHLTDPLRVICIIGGGGTAAAIAAWLVRNNCKAQILLLSSQATLFTRTANFFENRLFNDELLWESLGTREREEFANRLNRGVVWETVTDLLSDAPQLQLVYGSATGVTRQAGGGTNDLSVAYDGAVKPSSIEAHLVIDASGFDAWWFADLLPADLAKTVRDRRKRLMRTIRPDLSLRLRPRARLHVPMLSQAAGPGFLSLMVMGAMSDRIFAPYVV